MAVHYVVSMRYKITNWSGKMVAICAAVVFPVQTARTARVSFKYRLVMIPTC